MVQRLVLHAAIGRYPHTSALIDGLVSSNLVSLNFADVPTINRAFAPMVREGRFDVSEIAIATFLQAKAYGKPLVLLPVVMVARSQQAALLCRADSDVGDPSDLAGRRVGVRTYSQTTGVWLRGILADEYGIRPQDIRWITFEDAHVEEVRDPPWAKRAAPGKDLLAMLRQGELDAVIVGNDVPDDPMLRTVFRDPEASSEASFRGHSFVPVNHFVTMRSEIARERPDVVCELVRLFREAQSTVPHRDNDRDPYPIGTAAIEPAIALALRYSHEQGLLPRQMSVAEVWEGLPDGLA